MSEPQGRDRYLSDPEREALLTACKEIDPTLYLIVMLALSTGARRGEIMGLEWSDVNWQKGFATLRNECAMNCGVRVQLNSISEGLQDNLKRLDELWNEGLKRFGGPFLAGDSFCAVDAFFAPVAFRVQTFNLPLSKTAWAYAQRLLDLDAMRRWYEEALVEPWREPNHEKDVLNVGVVKQDLRVSHQG
jgi:glutathione S-transferase